MAERNWTTEQRQCIEARSGTLLVSAAAGSGKTSVLVERIIGRITDPEHPVDVDRMLVVTFTRPAAAEMKQRLSTALSERIAADPDDFRLQRQQMLLPGASISTIHGFCSALLRENFHLLDLSPQFRVAEEAETALLREEALRETLEERYTEGNADFTALADLLSHGKDDSAFADTVLRLYTFIQSHPFPNQWLEEKAAMYDSGSDPADTVWGRLIREHMADTLQYAKQLLQTARQLAGNSDALREKYLNTITANLQRMEQAQLDIQSKGWDAIGEALALCRPEALPRVYKCPDPAVKDRIQGLCKKAADAVGKLPDLLCFGADQCRDDIAFTGRYAAELFATVRLFTQKFDAKKKQRRMVDFNDLEHGALRLLLEPAETGGWQRTALAAELSERFEEILVDEYQDTNAAQDALFSAVSRDEQNLFFVGDVKQSIYGFRQAMPELFIRRRDAYPPYDGKEPRASIALYNNFRSRPQVTDAVNFVFRQLMTREACGIDYDKREELVPSASYAETAGCETELLIVSGSAGADDDSADKREARAIAERILDMHRHLEITDHGEKRPARFSDFCILMRSLSTHAAAFVDELKRCGVPAWTSSSGGFFQTPEVSSVIALLRFIDNPLQEIPLAASLFSPAFGFTPDDLARIRMLDRRAPLFTVVRRAAMARGSRRPDGFPADLQERCAAFLRKIDRFRTLSAVLPADKLLHRLYEECGLLAVAGAQKHGVQRVANLRLLQDYARSFEQNGFRGLTAFVRYLTRLEQQQVDLSPAATVSEHADVVRVMTIHRSKGLEFPVVFVARLSGRFNTDSTKNALLIHPELGVGMERRDMKTLRKWNTLPRQGVALAIRRSERAEELRVLYVAMTRAKEKLCLSMYRDDDLGKSLSSLAATLGTAEALSAHAVHEASSLGTWILSAALRHPSGAMLRSLAGAEDLPLLPAEYPWDIRIARAPESVEAEEEQQTSVPPDPVLLEQLRQRTAYVYPYLSLAAVPTKLAASELSEQGVSREFVAAQRPAFFHTKQNADAEDADGGPALLPLTPSERGTALHTFMQFARYREAAENPAAEIERLVSLRFLTPQQGDCIPLPKLRRFFAGPLYRRMQASPCVLREQHFTIPYPASALLRQEVSGEENLVIQGIADCVFEEDGRLVIVDYKTDRVKTPEELVERYREQLNIYAYALRQTLEKPVAECLLYSFALGREIPVDFSE